MSKIGSIIGSVGSLLGMGAPKVPAPPKAEVPAAPAPMTRTSTGAAVVVGSDAVKNQRVSGSRKGSTVRNKDPIGGLGASSGLSI